MAFRSCFSSSFLSSGLPRGETIREAGTILFDPTILATPVMVQICAVGIPARSSSFVSCAPQRVELPQVEVSKTAETPSLLSCSPMLRPIFLTFSKTQTPPEVE